MAGPLEDLIAYDVAEPEVRWANFASFGPGTPWRRGSEVAVDSAGNTLRYDGGTWHHVVQDWQLQGTGPHLGPVIRTSTVSPVSAGLLTEGHPVLVRHVTNSQTEGAVQLWSVDPETGAETFVCGPLTHGPDGYLYTFSWTQAWYDATRDEKDIYRVDPVTGACFLYVSVKGWTFVWDWAWDADGQLWAALRDSRRGQRFVTKVPAGGTTSSREAICDSDYDPRSLATGEEGTIYVMEWVPQNGDVHDLDGLYALTPGSGGGGKPPKKPEE